jgi:hypothetical protein
LVNNVVGMRNPDSAHIDDVLGTGLISTPAPVYIRDWQDEKSRSRI